MDAVRLTQKNNPGTLMPGKNMILAVAPSPSIDRALVIRGFDLSQINRPQQVLALAGGKGLNVARAVKRLGGAVCACALLEGHNGRWIAEQLASEGIPFIAAWGEGETRISISIIDPLRAGLTEIYEPSQPVSPQVWGRFEETLENSLAAAAWVTFSGSLPPGTPPDGMARLVGIVQRAGKPAAVDARGSYLASALTAMPALVKVNASEAGEALDVEVNSFGEAVAAAQALRKAGAGTAIITLGEKGAIAASAQGSWLGRAPSIPTLAPVGSGDAFLGALAFALERGDGLPDALRLAIAAGAANAMTAGVAMIDPGQVVELAERVIIERFV